jgi:hypothetical protein
MFVLPLLPAVILYEYYAAHHAGIDPAVHYNWGGWTRKILGPFLLFHAYGWKCDLLVIALWLLTAVLVFGARFKGALRPSWLVLALTALTLLYLVIPFQLSLTSDTDSRILPAILVCALAALVAALPALPLTLARVRLASMLLAICLVVRFGSIVYNWNSLERRLQPLADAMAHIEPGSRVLPVLLVPDASKDYPERHFLAWAVPTKNIFYPGLFHYSDQQPLVFRAPVPVSILKRANGVEVEGEKTRECYDYVCVIRLSDKTVRLPTEFEPVFAADAVTLWRVR